MEGRKHCLYCLREFDGRGRCCSQWCARKVNGKAAWVTRSRKEACARIMATAQRRVRFVPRWRQIALGEDPDGHLISIFGTLPASTPPRHGDTLDTES